LKKKKADTSVHGTDTSDNSSFEQHNNTGTTIEDSPYKDGHIDTINNEDNEEEGPSKNRVSKVKNLIVSWRKEDKCNSQNKTQMLETQNFSRKSLVSPRRMIEVN